MSQPATRDMLVVSVTKLAATDRDCQRCSRPARFVVTDGGFSEYLCAAHTVTVMHASMESIRTARYVA